MPFVVSKSVHGQPCIELENATHEQHWFLRMAVRENHTDSEFYKRKRSASPFLQGGYDAKEGWILIEFWGREETVQPYVDWLNQVFDKEIAEAKRIGLLEFDKECK